MDATDEVSRIGLPRAIPAEGLPCAIPADELQIMLGNSAAFCSWDSRNSTFGELTDHWPFLFSHSLSGTK